MESLNYLVPTNQSVSFRFGTSAKELLRISAQGEIKFNTEDYPDFLASDFAREFVKIVENYIISR